MTRLTENIIHYFPGYDAHVQIMGIRPSRTNALVDYWGDDSRGPGTRS